MKVAKWGNSLAIRIPADVVARLDLKEGDDVQVVSAHGKGLQLARQMSLEEAVAGIKRLQRPFPPGWKFDRDEANER